jgi:hypothetical protein
MLVIESKIRNQKSEIRNQRSEVGRQRSDGETTTTRLLDDGQRDQDRGRRSEVGGQKRGAARPQNHGHRRTELRDQGISDW